MQCSPGSSSRFCLFVCFLKENYDTKDDFMQISCKIQGTSSRKAWSEGSTLKVSGCGWKFYGEGKNLSIFIDAARITPSRPGNEYFEHPLIISV